MIDIIVYALKRNRGKMRLMFGFCPMCNSDAPEVYDCPCCAGYQSASGDKWPPSEDIKSHWWKIYVQAIRSNLIVSRQVCKARKSITEK